MQKTLTPIGNSLGLIIDRPILELLKVDETTVLELRLREDGPGLIIEPVRESHRERVRASTKKMMKTHARVLKKLAK